MKADIPNHQTAWEDAASLIDAGQCAAAVPILEKSTAADSTGSCYALLGLAYFRTENYGSAAAAYRRALELGPANTEWEEMFARAESNAIAEVQMPVPPIQYLDRGRLLAPPGVADGSLPTPARARRLIWAERVRRQVGSSLGHVATALMEGLTHLAGTVLGYHDRIWSNWYRRRLTLAILTLAYMRERLNRHNLKSTYPPGSLTGFQSAHQTPPEGVTHFRTADGSWNNLANPKEGAAGTRFLRNIELGAIRPETGRRLMSPSPREISRQLLTRENGMKEVPFLNLLAACWIQFENHDWISHGEILTNDVFEIPLAPDDPARTRYRQSMMFIGKTQPDPTWSKQEEIPLTFINEVTHWWDGSQIYGSDQQIQHHLRRFADGKLRLTPTGTLPVGKGGVEETGFQRNWWVGLTLLHTLFVREHNAICDRLKVSYPQWDDNRLFQVARLINAAVMAKIHTVEWTPAILPNPALHAALNANWFGVLTNLFEFGKDRKTLSEIKIRNPELGGVVGNPINKHGQPYGLTEEFVEVYRLHSLLPESLKLKKLSSDDIVDEIPLPATRQTGSHKLTARFQLADLFHSFGCQHPGQLTLNNYPRFLQELSIPGNPLFDMGAVDILRARERGVPRYNEFRRQLGLQPIASWADLTPNPDHIQRLKQVYGDQLDAVEALDLMIGTLAEGYRPTGFGFGETMFQIFILNATRRLQADRFYTDNYDEATYTKEGLDWIDEANLKIVLLRNYPELAATGLCNVSNAFEPWDTTKELDPARHPLRAFDSELHPDPWVGDAYRFGASGV